VTKWGTAALIAVALIAGGCSKGGDETAVERPTAEPAQALTALLTAEERGDHAASFTLLTAESRSTYADVDDWSRRRSQLPAVTGFTITSTEGDSVVALVEHEPGLDPFVGLRPARTRETWTARPESGAWRFDAEPSVEPILPDRGDAVDAALAWATAVQACDAQRTMSFQAVTRVFGLSEGADRLCGTAGALGATATELPSGPPTADLVSQYTSDALSWAAAVRIEGTPVPFSVVLAPIGDDWRVVSVFDG
jgi:hypothetical protein